MFTLSCEQDELTLPQAGEQALLLEESKANSDKFNIYYGGTYPIGGGIMRSLVQINHNDEVVAIGMMISERSLHRLPDMLQQYVLDFHKKAGERTPFKHILFDWNPEGYEPDNFYAFPLRSAPVYHSQ
jgi:hypothetical protein